MTRSDIAVEDLVAIGGVGQIQLRWRINDPHGNGLPYLRFHHAEIWRDGEQIGESTSGQFSDLVEAGATYDYEVRVVDASGNPSARSGIVSATSLVLQIGLGGEGQLVSIGSVD